MTLHYYTPMDFVKTSPMWANSIIPEMNNTPALVGAQLGYYWTELETSEGVYNFSDILARTADMVAIGKTFSIKLYLRSFGATTNVVPQYVRDNVNAEGGQFAYNSQNGGAGGYNIKLWNAYVRTRINALAIALGTALNGNVSFDMITLTETAYGSPVVPLTAIQEEELYEGRRLFTEVLVNAFPNKKIRNLCNYSREILTTFVPDVADVGSVIGWPDTMQDEPGLQTIGPNQGIYTYVPWLKSIGCIIAAEVQPVDYLYSRMDKTLPGYVPTIAQLADYASTNLQSDMIFWTRSGDVHPLTGNKVFTDLLNYLRSL